MTQTFETDAQRDTATSRTGGSEPSRFVWYELHTPDAAATARSCARQVGGGHPRLPKCRSQRAASAGTRSPHGHSAYFLGSKALDLKLPRRFSTAVTAPPSVTM
jgi:hypothetical protein